MIVKIYPKKVHKVKREYTSMCILTNMMDEHLYTLHDYDILELYDILEP